MHTQQTDLNNIYFIFIFPSFGYFFFFVSASENCFTMFVWSYDLYLSPNSMATNSLRTNNNKLFHTMDFFPNKKINSKSNWSSSTEMVEAFKVSITVHLKSFLFVKITIFVYSLFGFHQILHFFFVDKFGFANFITLIRRLVCTKIFFFRFAIKRNVQLFRFFSHKRYLIILKWNVIMQQIKKIISGISATLWKSTLPIIDGKSKTMKWYASSLTF